MGTVFEMGPEHNWGSWGQLEYCDDGRYINRMQVQYLPFQGGPGPKSWYHDYPNQYGRDPQDDIGITEISMFRCRHVEDWDGHPDVYDEETSHKFLLGENELGEKEPGYKYHPVGWTIENGYKSASECGNGWICGMQAKVQPYQGQGGAHTIDDAAIVGLKFQCCY